MVRGVSSAMQSLFNRERATALHPQLKNDGAVYLSSSGFSKIKLTPSHKPDFPPFQDAFPYASSVDRRIDKRLYT
jgi:hypothetical protein